MFLLTGAHQQGAHQWAGFQIEWTPGIHRSQTVCFHFALCLWKLMQVNERQRERRRSRVGDLHRLTSHELKGRAPDFMAPNNLKQAPLKHRQIKRSSPVDCDGLVVEGDIARHLPVQPDLLLGERKRRKLSVRTRVNAGLLRSILSLPSA